LKRGKDIFEATITRLEKKGEMTESRMLGLSASTPCRTPGGGRKGGKKKREEMQKYVR